MRRPLALLARRAAVCAAAMAVVAGAAGSAAAVPAMPPAVPFSQPGTYGRIDIAQFPKPRLVAPEPLLMEPLPPGAPRPEPVYLWVPPEHRARWERHCRDYRACSYPVYFIDHEWYRHNVMPRAVSRDALRDTQRDAPRDTPQRDDIRHDPPPHDDRERARSADDRDRARDRD